MKLQELMVKDVIQAAPDETVGVAGKRMRESAVGCLVVTVAGAVKGIVTDRDLLACLAATHDPYRCQIATHMRRPVHVLRPDEDHTIAAQVMRERRIKRLPIAHNGKLLGIVSLSDLAAIAGWEAEGLRTALRFFTAVVRTQASQSEPGREAKLTSRVVSPPAEYADDDREGLDTGGPG
ncbi:MAG TPA: CBS domain-containing protein [Candidatus Deferrimicrobium sp.]|nr:CBS domain-containing protein [Candidatus Deferrimicrobium sp.]